MCQEHTTVYIDVLLLILKESLKTETGNRKLSVNTEG
jgi:hypothetical protein